MTAVQTRTSSQNTSSLQNTRANQNRTSAQALTISQNEIPNQVQPLARRSASFQNQAANQNKSPKQVKESKQNLAFCFPDKFEEEEKRKNRAARQLEAKRQFSEHLRQRRNEGYGKKKNEYIEKHKNKVQPEVIRIKKSELEELAEIQGSLETNYGSAFTKAQAVKTQKLDDDERRKVIQEHQEQLEQERYQEALRKERASNPRNILLEKTNQFDSAKKVANDRNFSSLGKFKKVQLVETQKQKEVVDIEESRFARAFHPTLKPQDYSKTFIHAGFGELPMNKTGDAYQKILDQHDENEKKEKNEIKEKVSERTHDAIRRNLTEKQNRMLEQELQMISETETAVEMENLKRLAKAAVYAPSTYLT